MESDEALLHLLDALEKTKPCQNLLIEARSSFKKCLIVLEGQVDKVNEENNEIQDKMRNMQKTVEVLTKLLKELESSVFTETQSVTLREKLHGRNGEYQTFEQKRSE